jgi:hypothetical protein
MSTSGRRKCLECGVWFRPERRNAHRQRYCGARECRAASKRASQRKWSRRNPGYFHGETHVRRIQAWRRVHPGYWKPKGEGGGPEPPGALQDLSLPQAVDESLVAAIRDRLFGEISRPLQDLLSAQACALAGLVCMVSGDALQEDIVRTLGACYEQGQRIGGRVPWMPRKEPGDERTRSDRAAAAAAHPAAV